jgi:hypothetical protein
MEKNLKLINFFWIWKKSHGQQKQLPSPKRLWWVVDLEESAQPYVQSHPQLVCTLDVEKGNTHPRLGTTLLTPVTRLWCTF